MLETFLISLLSLQWRPVACQGVKSTLSAANLLQCVVAFTSHARWRTAAWRRRCPSRRRWWARIDECYFDEVRAVVLVLSRLRRSSTHRCPPSSAHSLTVALGTENDELEIKQSMNYLHGKAVLFVSAL